MLYRKCFLYTFNYWCAHFIVIKLCPKYIMKVCIMMGHVFNFYCPKLVGNTKDYSRQV